MGGQNLKKKKGLLGKNNGAAEEAQALKKKRLWAAEKRGAEEGRC